jgi:hypothetical protein
VRQVLAQKNKQQYLEGECSGGIKNEIHILVHVLANASLERKMETRKEQGQLPRHNRLIHMCGR